jgi:hypothetical protein
MRLNAVTAIEILKFEVPKSSPIQAGIVRARTAHARAEALAR